MSKRGNKSDNWKVKSAEPAQQLLPPVERIKPNISQEALDKLVSTKTAKKKQPKIFSSQELTQYEYITHKTLNDPQEHKQSLEDLKYLRQQAVNELGEDSLMYKMLNDEIIFREKSLDQLKADRSQAKKTHGSDSIEFKILDDTIVSRKFQLKIEQRSAMRSHRPKASQHVPPKANHTQTVEVPPSDALQISKPILLPKSEPIYKQKAERKEPQQQRITSRNNGNSHQQITVQPSSPVVVAEPVHQVTKQKPTNNSRQSSAYAKPNEKVEASKHPSPSTQVDRHVTTNKKEHVDIKQHTPKSNRVNPQQKAVQRLPKTQNYKEALGIQSLPPTPESTTANSRVSAQQQQKVNHTQPEQTVSWQQRYPKKQRRLTAQEKINLDNGIKHHTQDNTTTPSSQNWQARQKTVNHQQNNPHK